MSELSVGGLGVGWTTSMPCHGQVGGSEGPLGQRRTSNLEMEMGGGEQGAEGMDV
jgi:hypothetical protein